MERDHGEGGMTQPKPEDRPRGDLWFWAVAYVAGVFATSALARWAGLEQPWSVLAYLVPMLLLIPMVRARNRRDHAAGFGSPALAKWNKLGTAFAVLFVMAMLGTAAVSRELEPEGALAWVLALLPAAPFLGMLWSAAGYMRDEEDEYLRANAIFAALVATAVLLTGLTVWGFLEAAGLVPHAPVLLGVLTWTVSFGITNWARRTWA